MKRLPQAVASGVSLTVLFTITGIIIGSITNSRAAACIFVWQACLLQLVVHTPDNPIREASPIDLFAFVLGLLLGIPIYTLLSYAYLSWRKKKGVE